MAEELTTGKRLYRSFMAWQESEQRLAFAQQSLQGALQERLDKQARFNGQVEFVAGGLCSWRVDPAKEEIIVELLPEPPKSDEKIVELPRPGADSAPAGPESETAAPTGTDGEAAAVPSPS